MRCPAGERLNRIDNFIQQHLDRQIAAPPHDLFQPAFFKILILRVLGLCDPVGEHDQQIAGLQGLGAGLVGYVGHHAEDDAAHLQPIEGSVRVIQIGRIVTGVDIGEGPFIQINHSIKKGDEFIKGGVGLNEIIQPADHFADVALHGDAVAQASLQAGHQQAGGDAFA